MPKKVDEYKFSREKRLEDAIDSTDSEAQKDIDYAADAFEPEEVEEQLDKVRKARAKKAKKPSGAMGVRG